MDLAENLRTDCIQAGTVATEKQAVLREIAKLAKQHPALKAYTQADIFEALQDREAVSSTGFGDGIAIPHCALDKVDTFVVGMLTAPEGVDFDAYDGKPTKLLAFIVGPSSKRNEHVSVLSSLSRILNNSQAVQEFLAIQDPEALRESILRYHSGRPSGKQKAQCLCHVFVQREEKFEDILTIFTSSVVGEISVIEASNAGNYLNRMPMFASFWSEQTRGFCRIIVAVVEKGLVNDLVRRIHLEVDNLEEETGVLVTVQELLIARGSLDF